MPPFSCAHAPTSAIATGFLAVLLWTGLTVLTVLTAPTPPLLLNALCFWIGGGLGLVWLALSGQARSLRRVPARAYVIGTLGLFGYHALYFAALRLAPPVEAGLINYLWPLLIVLLSGLLPGETLRHAHVLGAALAFCGAVVILNKGFTGTALLGYALAAMAALTWARYSLLSRRIGDVPTAAVAVFCLGGAALSLVLHLALENPAWPATALGWVAIAALGTGPVGLAFFVWDIGVKRGNIQLLGTLSYAAPLLSTLALVAADMAQPSLALGLAAQ
ncbi:MAG: DMT family transporter [Roseinatronobacter sp.]